jgi:hypothetical protein
MAQANAESAITSASLTVGTISHAYSNTVPAGNIISQVPAAGTSVVINSAVQLVISDGPQIVIVPNVAGMTQANAESAIISASLVVGTISHTYSTTVPAGDIISQNPAAGTSVVINSSVDLVVSKVFDEGIGTIAGDSSGNANHGTLINGPIWTTGEVNGGLNLDGVNDYVEVPDAPSFDIVDEITVSAWINPVDVNAFRTILSKFAYTPAYRKDLYWFLYNDRIGASLAGPSGGSKNSVIRNNMSRSFGLSGEGITADHNIDIDDYGPEILFVDYQNHDLRHQIESPAIDAGSDQLAPGTDIEGKLRPFGLGYDIGPYELAVLYVSTGSPNDPGSGTPWGPYRRIQDAIDNAQKDYLIRIAGGTYNESITLVDGIYLYGGYNCGYWNAPRNPIANVTIIDGNSPNVDVVSIIDVNVVIDGFTVTNTTTPDIGGSGIFCEGSSPTIRNCIIASISSNVDGGGMYNYRGSPTLINCTFNGNSNSGAGGGMYNYSSNPTLVNCTFIHNHAERGGGGMYNSFSNPTVINCTFFGNSTGNFGGGMANGNSSPELTNCIFWGNTDGGGTGTDELAQIYGGTISVTFSCIQDWTGALGGTGNIGVDPCFVDTDNDDYHLKSQAGRWKPSDYTNLDATGDGFINLFDFTVFAKFWQKKGESIPVDLDNSGAVDLSDLALLLDNYLMNYLPGVWVFDNVTSRCIDVGNPGSPLGEEMLSVSDDPNKEWGQNLRINIGAYGGTAEASTPPYDWALLADLTNDGTVNFADLVHWVENWLSNDNEWPGDIDRNGIVDMFDFALLAQDYLEHTIWHEQ